MKVEVPTGRTTSPLPSGLLGLVLGDGDGTIRLYSATGWPLLSTIISEPEAPAGGLLEGHSMGAERRGRRNAVGTQRASVSEFDQRRCGRFCAAVRRLVGGLWGVRWGGRTAMLRAALARERPLDRTRSAGRWRGAYGGAPRRCLILTRTIQQASHTHAIEQGTGLGRRGQGRPSSRPSVLSPHRLLREHESRTAHQSDTDAPQARGEDIVGHERRPSDASPRPSRMALAGRNRAWGRGQALGVDARKRSVRAVDGRTCEESL